MSERVTVTARVVRMASTTIQFRGDSQHSGHFSLAVSVEGAGSGGVGAGSVVVTASSLMSRRIACRDGKRRGRRWLRRLPGGVGRVVGDPILALAEDQQQRTARRER